MSSKELKVEKIAGPFGLGEGPHWDDEEQVLYFVDIFDKKIFCFDPETKKLTNAVIKNGPVGCVVPVAGKKNTFIAGCGTELVEVIWDPKADNLNPEIKVLSTVVEKTKTRFNDGKVDPAGRLWAGTMGYAVGKTFPPNEGTLYRFGDNYAPIKTVGPVTISNGLAWSLDNTTFYYIDSPTFQVFAYDYDIKTGDISKQRTIFNFTKNGLSGFPDGMTIDKSGNLWIACYDGGRVIQIDPKSGKLLREIELPAKEITSVAFGGKNRDILYVTSARQWVNDENKNDHPMAGCLFAIHGLGESGNPMMSLKV